LSSTTQDLISQAIGQLEPTGSAGASSTRTIFAPARINLIGEHIDYCGGRVLPAAISFGTAIAVRKKNDKNTRVVSVNQPDSYEFNPEGPNEPRNHWSDYVVGVFEAYRNLGVRVPALDISVAGNIPGSCLSSSASLGVGIALVIEGFIESNSGSDDIEHRKQIALRVQDAENHFVGVNCGIMDQAAVACGKQGHAMLLDCKNLDITYIPVNTGTARLLIADTRKDRSLVTSAYNQRRQEVDRALAIIQQSMPVTTLCDIDIEALDQALHVLDDALLQRRVRHVVMENDRVSRAVDCLKLGQTKQFGRLLNESHSSLQQDYDVTGIELDTLVAEMQAHAGVLGARMMGAGFGGCSIALVEPTETADLIETVTRRYEDRIGYPPAFHEVTISPGAAEV
jgi:galactokinase